MHGKVQIWYLTEEERLAYIAKYPIKETEKPRGAAYSNINTQAVGKDIKNPKVTIHSLFMQGKKIKEIARILGMKEYTVHNHIKQQRKINPDKWPMRR